jgi:hypothetical protein
MANPDEMEGTMNKLMLELALAAIDFAEFAESDQTVASSLAHTSSRQHQKKHVKYARRRLVEAQELLAAACARLHDNEETHNAKP